MGTSLQKFTAQRVESAPVPATIEEAVKIGEIMARSGMFLDDPKDDWETHCAKAVAKVIAGRELGLGPMAALRGIFIIKGRTSLSSETVATLIKRSRRYDFRAEVGKDTATVTIYDRGEALSPVTFTVDDAKTAKLVAADSNWVKYPGDMCFTKAIIRGARRHCPEVLGGAVYLEDEDLLAENPETGEVVTADPVTGEVIDSTAVDEPSPAEDAAPVVDMEALATERSAALKEAATKAGIPDITPIYAAAGAERKRDLADDVIFERAMAAVVGWESAQGELVPAGSAKGEDPHT